MSTGIVPVQMESPAASPASPAPAPAGGAGGAGAGGGSPQQPPAVQQQQFMGGDQKAVPFAGNTTDTVNKHTIGIVHKQKLHDCSWCADSPVFCGALLEGPSSIIHCVTCGWICDGCCWKEKLSLRAYAAVHKNRLEFNRPIMMCCGICMRDRVSVHYFDQLHQDMVPVHCCSPFHLFCCCGCAGGVTATAPCGVACLNCCLCNCCRTFFHGLSDTDTFTRAYNSARGMFDIKQRPMTRIN